MYELFSASGECTRPRYTKPKTLLAALLRLEPPDLDFASTACCMSSGLKHRGFPDKDLLPQVKATCGCYKTAAEDQYGNT